MLGFFTYPNKLTSALMARGFGASELPPVDRYWIGLIHEFRKAGYSPDQAATVLGAALTGDSDALAQTLMIGGAYAKAVFDPQR